MSLEDIMLPEDKNCVNPLKIIRLREAEQDGGCQGLGRRGNGQLQSSGSNVSVTYIQGISSRVCCAVLRL